MSGTVTTQSRAKMIFLTWFKGHRMSFRVRRPRSLVAGMVLYDTTWVLLPSA